VHIREIAHGDAELLGGFFESLAADPAADRFRPHPLTAEYAEQLVDGVGSRKDRYFIALEGEELLGYGMLRGWDESYEIPAFGVAVAPTARGKGVGRSLMRYALDVAREVGATSVMLKVHPDNADAKHLYESEGFVFDSLAEDGVQLKGTVLL